MKRLILLAIAGAAFATTTSANAITVELAKACRAVATKAFPYAQPGSKSGTAKAQRDAYLRCLDNNGALPAQSGQANAPATPK